MTSEALLYELIPKYSAGLPRYTSYPTAVELKPTNEFTLFTDRLLCVTQRKAPMSLYVHLPYCRELCYFCACHKLISRDKADVGRYLDLLDRECSLIRELCGDRLPLSQIHLGGGTPSFLTVEELEHLGGMLTDHFNSDPLRECSVECDPRTTSEDKIAWFIEHGFNRFSIGVQDFDPLVQEIVNREHSFETVAALFNWIRSRGVFDINIDLIYGLPGQTPASMAKTISLVCELAPTRIALYGYAHVTWKVKVQNVFHKHPLPEPSERLTFFLQAMEQLQEAGYLHVGLDHFALPGDSLVEPSTKSSVRRNFMGYTTVFGEGVLGIGLSSLSDIDGLLTQNVTDLQEYRSRLDRNELPIGRQYERTPEDRLRSFCIERLMCEGDLTLEQVREKCDDQDLCARIFHDGCALLKPLAKDGIVVLADDSISIPPVGKYFLRNIASAFDTFLPAHRAQQKKIFSQSV